MAEVKGIESWMSIRNQNTFVAGFLRKYFISSSSFRGVNECGTKDKWRVEVKGKFVEWVLSIQLCVSSSEGTQVMRLTLR